MYFLGFLLRENMCMHLYIVLNSQILHVSFVSDIMNHLYYYMGRKKEYYVGREKEFCRCVYMNM